MYMFWPPFVALYKDIKKPIPPAQTYFFNFRVVIQYTIVNGTLITHLKLAQIILYIYFIF